MLSHLNAPSRQHKGRSGGDIKAFSDLGVGSIFELILPKKTNIKNISDDKVSISSKDEDIVIEDIVLFDMEEINVKKKHLLQGKVISKNMSKTSTVLFERVFMDKKVKKISNEMREDEYELVTMSITNSAKAILIFKKI